MGVAYKVGTMGNAIVDPQNIQRKSQESFGIRIHGALGVEFIELT